MHTDDDDSESYWNSRDSDPDTSRKPLNRGMTVRATDGPYKGDELTVLRANENKAVVLEQLSSQFRPNDERTHTIETSKLEYVRTSEKMEVPFIGVVGPYQWVFALLPGVVVLVVGEVFFPAQPTAVAGILTMVAGLYLLAQRDTNTRDDES